MIAIFSPDKLARTYRDPIALIILAVDLFPVYAVLALGWGAAPLVFLYWLENLVVGVFALARMIAASVKDGLAGGLGVLFLGPFFVFHYGMFCFVHGVFVSILAAADTGGAPDFPSPIGLVETALSSGAHMGVFLAALGALQGFLFLRDFIARGQFRETSIMAEMAAPYGRIVVLHLALFAGMAMLAVAGQPLFGILALIGLRALWGVYLTVARRSRLDAITQVKVDAPSPI